jgi:hypothetical protein
VPVGFLLSETETYPTNIEHVHVFQRKLSALSVLRQNIALYKTPYLVYFIYKTLKLKVTGKILARIIFQQHWSNMQNCVL